LKHKLEHIKNQYWSASRYFLSGINWDGIGLWSNPLEQLKNYFFLFLLFIFILDFVKYLFDRRAKNFFLSNPVSSAMVLLLKLHSNYRIRNPKLPKSSAKWLLTEIFPKPTIPTWGRIDQGHKLCRHHLSSYTGDG